LPYIYYFDYQIYAEFDGKHPEISKGKFFGLSKL
jgi:hypothetical protein